MEQSNDQSNVTVKSDYEITELPVEMEVTERAQYDIQIATAKKYPRGITKAINNCIAVVTRSEDAARKCNYSLPRGGKNITGKSVHLARLIAQNWGNLRAESKVVGVTDKQVISEAIAFDLETNYAVKFQVRKSILGKGGVRYTEDMIVVTGNAANSIAYRNAVLAIIPEQISDEVYQAALNKITGDLTNEQRIIAKRDEMLKKFKDIHGVSEDEILKVLNKNTINSIGKDEIVTLIGLDQAILDGDTSIDDAFGRIKNRDIAQKMDKIYSEPQKQDVNSTSKNENKPPVTTKEDKSGQPKLM